MTPGHLKGALLEYLIRRILQNCGFSTVKPDGHYIFQHSTSGLFFINGKGAAHDADVLMEPPIQMPFSYPSRVLFECKAYKKSIGLGVVRNALGLRYDINDFEIVTDDSIDKRKNNRRASYAIADRKRFNYHVGIGTIDHPTTPAFEFAANNKIPIICLRWLLPGATCDLFRLIDSAYVTSIRIEVREELLKFLKEKDERPPGYNSVQEFLERDTVVGEIIRGFRSVMYRGFIALTESGDLLFLIATSEEEQKFLRDRNRFDLLTAQIHYYTDDPTLWELDLFDHRGQRPHRLRFYVPERIMKVWREFSLDRKVAIDLKEQFFSRIFIFVKEDVRSRLPFVTATIDRDWIDSLRARP